MDDPKSENPTWKYSEAPEGAAEYYANHLHIFWTGVDLTLIFGELVHSAENNAKTVLEAETQAKITMTWSVAKLVMSNLAEAIAKYEEKNGELKLPGKYALP